MPPKNVDTTDQLNSSPDKAPEGSAQSPLLPEPPKDDNTVNEIEHDPQSSRNSSQNGSRVYDKEYLLSRREYASDDAVSSSSCYLKEIVKKVRFFFNQVRMLY